MIVGNDDFKEAAMIAEANFNVLGTLIAGKQGIGKVIARAIRQLLPPTILRVKGSPYDMDSSGEGGLDGLLLQEMI
jgi:Mg-chelatase subunit ChlI